MFYGGAMRSSATGALPEISESTRQAVMLLLRRGPMTRSELARRLRLSKAALTKITRPLLEIGLVQEGATLARSSPGRPFAPLSVNVDFGSFVGVKLTGDRSYAVLTDLSGTVIDARDEPLPSTDLATVSTAIVDQIKKLSGDSSPARVGVSLAGSVLRSTGHVLSSPFLGWRNVDLATTLTEHLTWPVSVENDLRALTVAQHWSEESVASMVMVTFGAGVGCGLVLNHKLLVGQGGVSGAVNHLRIRDDGPPCHRGHHGCVSGFATTKAILTAVHPDTNAQNLSDVAAMARNGDRLALSVLADAGYAMGCLIGTICNITGPEQVVLSGEGAALLDLLDASLQQGITEVIHPAVPPVTLVVKQLPFTEWARGAALVAIEDHLAPRTQ